MKNTSRANSSLETEYLRQHKKGILLILISSILVLICGIIFTGIGTAGTTIKDILSAISRVLFHHGELENAEQKIILYLRLPRIVLGILCGMGLSVSGVALQGVTRNSLVSPFTLGISSAAAFGASLSIVFGFGFFAGTNVGIVLNAFLFAILCTILVYGISSRVGMTPETIILAGIAFNYLFNASDAVVKFFASDHQLAAAVQWAFGSLNGATWAQVLVVLCFLVPCFIGIYLHSQSLNVLSTSNDEVAKSLGISPLRVRGIVGIFSVLTTAAIISFTGVIGFVGLAGPHIARLLIGGDHRYLIPFSAITGALLVLIADTLGRNLLSPVNIPVGIVVSFLGVPIFIHLILSKRKGVV